MKKYIILILVLFITSCATPEKTVTKKEALLCQAFADYIGLQMTMCKARDSLCYKSSEDLAAEILFFAAACQDLLPRCQGGKK